MSINAIGVNAYNSVQKAINSAGSAASSGVTNAGGGGFGDLLSSAIKDGVNTIKNTENVSASAISGKASISDVVNAMNSADIALKTIVTVRDKVIGAYQDILKMPM
jgi:flagellar hook-basal body complex protein FliE